MSDGPHLPAHVTAASIEQFPPASLDSMIAHDDVLERYPWLSAQILNRWRRKRLIRSFRGSNGTIVYSVPELELALCSEMRLELEAEPSVRSRKYERNDSPEADIIHERLSMRKVFGKKGLPAGIEADFERRLDEIRLHR